MTINEQSLLKRIAERKSELEEAVKQATGYHLRHLTGQRKALVELETEVLDGEFSTPSTPVQGYRDEIPSWEEIAGIQEARALQAEAELSELRQALSQTDIQPTEQIDYRDRYEEAVQLLKEVSELISWRNNGSGKEEALRLIYQWASRPPGINSTEDQPGPSISTEEEETE